MRSRRQRRMPTLVLALVAAATGGALGAADVEVTPNSGGSFVVKNAGGTPQFQVRDSGEVHVPGLPGTAANGAFVCHDANGQLTKCTAVPAGATGALRFVCPYRIASA